jgi:hypothetical protein
MSLSTALCRPTSSRTASSSPAAVNRPAACSPPVRSNTFLVLAQRVRKTNEQLRRQRGGVRPDVERRPQPDGVDTRLATDARTTMSCRTSARARGRAGVRRAAAPRPRRCTSDGRPRPRPDSASAWSRRPRGR